MILIFRDIITMYLNIWVSSTEKVKRCGIDYEYSEILVWYLVLTPSIRTDCVGDTLTQ